MAYKSEVIRKCYTSNAGWFYGIKIRWYYFFEIGPNGAHQLYNNNKQPCKFLDLSTDFGIDICEYPDSGKINILPYEEVYQSNEIVDYYKGEEKVEEKWKIEDRT